MILNVRSLVVGVLQPSLVSELMVAVGERFCCFLRQCVKVVCLREPALVRAKWFIYVLMLSVYSKCCKLAACKAAGELCSLHTIASAAMLSVRLGSALHNDCSNSFTVWLLNIGPCALVS